MYQLRRATSPKVSFPLFFRVKSTLSQAGVLFSNFIIALMSLFEVPTAIDLDSVDHRLKRVISSAIAF